MRSQTKETLFTLLATGSNYTLDEECSQRLSNYCQELSISVEQLKLSIAKKGYKWNKESLLKRSITRSKLVKQYDLKGNFIKIWNSIKEAGITLCIARGSISSCLKGKLLTAGKYKWEYI